MNKAEPASPEATPVQEAHASEKLIDALEKLPDKELQAVISKAQTLLAAREQERKRAAERQKQEQQQEALREIQRIAKQFGLKVGVMTEKRKPGRPRKAKAPEAK